MKKYIHKDKNLRTKFKNFELNRCCKTALFTNQPLKIKDRNKIGFYKTFQAKEQAFTKICNRCIITGRSKGVARMFKISRMNLREILYLNKIREIKRATW